MQAFLSAMADKAHDLLAGTTERQIPILHDLNASLIKVESLANAVNDNSWEDGIPPADALIKVWRLQLARIDRAITNAAAAHSPSEVQ
jgi:hypothetical protein